jgi:hypothetical protein
MLLPPPSSLPFKIFAVIFFLLLLSSPSLDINRSGLILFAEASRAYPHGCLYRHPSYYTYDERDDISWFNHQNNYDETFSAQLSTSATTTAIATAAMSSTAASEFTDYRKLPPQNHPIRRSYEQYKLLRRLGAGKFSNVFEAVDVYMAAASVYANNNDDDDAIQKKRRKKITSSAALEQDVDDALSNEATTTTDSSDNESTTSQSSSSSSTKPTIDPNTLVVLKCLKPISERKIRRELLVLTHCQNLPNLARLIGIVIPSSMDVEEENNDGKGAVVDDKEGNDAVNEKRVNGGGEKESRRHHQSLQHHHQQQSHNHRKRRRYSHRASRQSQQKQHNQQRRRHQHQDIGSITTDAHNLPEKDANHLSNKKNVNNGNNNGGNKKNNNNSSNKPQEGSSKGYCSLAALLLPSPQIKWTSTTQKVLNLLSFTIPP